MRPLWKGAISFGLVNIPVSLYPATSREELRFSFLRKSDMSRVNNKRVAAADGQEVAWKEIVRGYEYEKDKFVVIKDEDFERVDVEATQTVDIQEFVQLDEIDPVFFVKPYYIEPGKGAGKAYALLRDVLGDSGKVGIAKVVIRTREHLAAVKARGNVLVLEIMHFAQDLSDTRKLAIPRQAKPSKRELEAAEQLVEHLTRKWEPEHYRDEYKDALMDVIEEKIAAGGKEAKAPPKRAPKKATSVSQLVAMLQRSLRQSARSSSENGHREKKTAPPRRGRRH